ncbi:heparinase II/III family protein [Occultella kanbiaonis]|uniref:heparinase II/III domain-containing protein n=1 Tax=Occultella kanbiaonis TaxID=2675754 RepID=UPI0013D75590|nr:heparinase II/III family protein [Occultella kanbiaonis]
MTDILGARGGWWHNYVCPTHGTELLPADGETYPCPHGCRLQGEPYASAWTVLDHQAKARAARHAAHRYRADGRDADRDEATRIIRGFARVHHDLAGDWSDRAEPWMLRGRLFAQALTEAIWAVQLADAIVTLGPDAPMSTDVVELLEGLLTTVAAARETLVVDRGEPGSNYTAWLDAAGGMLNRALEVLGRPADVGTWVARTFEHLELAVAGDGWEWEGSTYYHLFVLRAYLLNLRGTRPADLPAAAVARLAAMVAVLSGLATGDGTLPMLHDGPYDRDGVHLEVLEIAALAGGLWRETGLDRVVDHARRRLAGRYDGLEDTLGPWFDGDPLPALTVDRASVHFADAGYLILRDATDSIQAIVDAGPHGGSHGHLDKLALYLYGADGAWQPAPGVPPYGSPLRRGHYARTLAHPTVRVDDADQNESSAVVTAWEVSADRTRAAAQTDTAIDGVRLRREVILAGGCLVDVMRAETLDGAARDVTLALRPAVALTVWAADGGWRSRWAAETGVADPDRSVAPGPAQPAVLHGLHAATAAADLVLGPGRGPSDDPSRLVHVADWTATAADVTFVSVYAVGTTPGVLTIEATDGQLTVGVGAADGTRTTYEVMR